MDIFSTQALNGVVAGLKRSPGWLHRTFFPRVQDITGEEIYFDVEIQKRRISPFVSPKVAGQIVQDIGYDTKLFKPAYVKDKRVFEPHTRPFKRAMGEAIGGSMSPEQRLLAAVNQSLADQISMIDRRKEVMASEILRTGSLTVSGDLYPSVTVNFQRDNTLTVTKGGGTKWTDAGINPLNDLQDWSLLMQKLVGVAITDVVMTVDVWKVFREHASVKDRLGLQRALGQMPSMSQGPQKDAGGVFQGEIDTFRIWAYADWYIDPADDTEKPILPDNTVLFGAPGMVEGYVAHGAIKDEAAGLQPLEYFTKSWVDQDPSVRYLLMQSAPLLVPYRPNACGKAAVL